MKKNGVKSAILKVPISSNIMSFWNDFQSYFNRDVYSVKLRKAKGCYHYHLSLKHMGLRIPVGPQLVDRLNFMRKALNERTDAMLALQQKLTIQVHENDTLRRETIPLKSKARAFNAISNLLTFISGMGPDAVEGISYVVRYAKDHGLIHDEGAKNAKQMIPKELGRTMTAEETNKYLRQKNGLTQEEQNGKL
uniref:Uncharacterized protein n=1 Tax=viral metagenome TaxID=1070528 RepID=A0A6M3JE60_9ZZZZ